MLSWYALVRGCDRKRCVPRSSNVSLTFSRVCFRKPTLFICANSSNENKFPSEKAFQVSFVCLQKSMFYYELFYLNKMMMKWSLPKTCRRITSLATCFKTQCKRHAVYFFNDMQCSTSYAAFVDTVRIKFYIPEMCLNLGSLSRRRS